MKAIASLLTITIIFLFGTVQKAGNSTRYIFYLHGRIVEVQGANALSQQYGKYEYDSIIQALKDMGKTH